MREVSFEVAGADRGRRDARRSGLKAPPSHALIWVGLILLQFGVLSPAAAAPLRLAVSRTPLSLPIYVADRFGYFASEGVEVELVELVGGHRCMQALLDGEADLATSSETVVMFRSFDRRDFAVVATFVSTYNDVKIITGPGSGINVPQDMAGRRVGTVLGAAANYYLDTLLIMNGVDPQSVEVVGLQPEAVTAALESGDVAAVSIWEPFGFMALAALPEAGMLPESGIYRLSFNLVADAKLLDVRDSEIVEALRALARAQAFIAENPAAAQEVLREHLSLDQKFIEWVWSDYNYRLSLDQSLLTTLEAEARWARRSGQVNAGHSPDYLDFISTGHLGTVSPQAVTIIK